MNNREFRLSIDVTVTWTGEGMILSPLINEALQELVNRRDFRHGFIEPGRAITHLHDHQAVKVTVDVNRLSIPASDPE